MKNLKERICNEATVVGSDIVKVDHFLNHQVDVKFLNEIGREFTQRFKGKQITKILTVEASGIAVACISAQYFDVPVVFAKKSASRNLDEDTFVSEVYSFTRNSTYQMKVSKKYLDSYDRVLIIDDFLANGKAVMGLIDIIHQAGAKLIGVGIVIEKGFQPGGRLLRQSGVDLQSLAILEAITEKGIVFREKE
ncbi:xanthine phosphoribosyltransferase [Syntrophomonas erecta]